MDRRLHQYISVLLFSVVIEWQQGKFEHSAILNQESLNLCRNDGELLFSASQRQSHVNSETVLKITEILIAAVFPILKQRNVHLKQSLTIVTIPN